MIVVPRPLAHPLNATPPSGQISHQNAGKTLRRLNLHPHQGLQQNRPGLLHAVAEGQPPGQPEGELIGVHVMVAPVVKHSPEIDHGKAGQPAARRRFLDAFLDRWNKGTGNRPAENLVDELKTCAQGQRLQADPAVAKLSVASALLLMPALGARRWRGSSPGKAPWAP